MNKAQEARLAVYRAMMPAELLIRERKKAEILQVVVEARAALVDLARQARSWKDGSSFDSAQTTRTGRTGPNAPE